jgi:hypothetical protein
LADELCLPVNTPKTPKEKPRTLVESGLIGGVYYSQAVVKDAAGKMVPGLVQEVIEIPDKPEYEVSTGYVYKRLPSEKGYSVPGIAAVTILFGIRWGVQTVSVASSAGGSLGGAISSSSHGGGLNSASMSGVTDVIRLAHWKGTRCVANKEWVEQMVSLSVGEANADCRTLVQGDEGLTVAKFTGTPECQLRWGVEIKAERKSIMGNLAKVAKPPQAVKPQVAVSAAKAPQ